jgi:DNA-binding protein HU-beta
LPAAIVGGKLGAQEDPMNRTEIVAALALRSGLSNSDARRAVDGLFDPGDGVIVRALRRNRKVRITGFGTFEPRRRPARIGRNPRTGEQIRVASSTSVGFRPGRPLREGLA